MEFKVSENNMCTPILILLNRVYKGKIVKINFQSFKDSRKDLKLSCSLEEFRAEITGFTEGINGALYVELYILDIILYDYYHNGTGVIKPLNNLFLPLERVKDKYVYNKVSSLVMVDYYDRKLGQLQDTAFSGDKQAVKKLCDEIISEVIKEGKDVITVGKVQIMKGVWRSIGHVNIYYFGGQLVDILTTALKSKTTEDRGKKFTVQEFEKDMQDSLYKWVINEYMLNEDIL
jgi:hypothetical protein